VEEKAPHFILGKQVGRAHVVLRQSAHDIQVALLGLRRISVLSS
jgi:hypothetical protein